MTRRDDLLLRFNLSDETHISFINNKSVSLHVSFSTACPFFVQFLITVKTNLCTVVISFNTINNNIVKVICLKFVKRNHIYFYLRIATCFGVQRSPSGNDYKTLKIRQNTVWLYSQYWITYVLQ